MKKVIILTTGGTIAMRSDASRGVVPAVGGQELIDSVPGLGLVCPLEVEEFSNIPSPHMTPRRMFALADKVEEHLGHDDVAGVVITHGTDLLEETAYLLDLMHGNEKPVCLTGAMRSAEEISPDGPVNLLCAVRTAVCPSARRKGVLVVMNEEIHAAREVVKSHSANTETFVSPFWGPLGYVDPDRVVFRREPLGRQILRPSQLVGDVHLIKLVSGSDASVVDFLTERGVAGLVLEAFGRGNVPPAVLPGIQRAVAKGIPVVITTRTVAGRVLDVYGYEGGAKTILQAGAILGGETSGPKARLKLMLALGLTSSRDELAAFFDTP
ncbi:MAG: asparaginase [Bilophila sp.]